MTAILTLLNINLLPCFVEKADQNRRSSQSTFPCVRYPTIYILIRSFFGRASQISADCLNVNYL
ncbi:hypothetical protein REMIM1_PE00457 (plasmid) [Rhizobium etli bv. mimosae str. Mim1]|nr:hypothetical protein REMIM1_PE00457 [Rhizobium etli bv. mimosae str. Mim1]